MYVPADSLTQLNDTSVSGVFGFALFKSCNGCLTDIPRCLEIRLANAQRDDIIHLSGNIKKLSDARRLHIFTFFSNKFIVVHHGETNPLSSAASFSIKKPCSLYCLSTKCVDVDITPSMLDRRLATNSAISL